MWTCDIYQYLLSEAASFSEPAENTSPEEKMQKN